MEKQTSVPRRQAEVRLVLPEKDPELPQGEQQEDLQDP